MNNYINDHQNNVIIKHDGVIATLLKYIEDNMLNNYSLKQILQEHKKALEIKITEYEQFVKNIDRKMDSFNRRRL